jgi:hypothetical protein
MASFKSILGNLQSINLEKLHVRNELQFNEDNYSVRHVLDPATGKYEVINSAGVKYMSMNHDGTQNSSVLKNSTDAVQNTVSAHATQLTRQASTLATQASTILSHSATITSHTNTLTTHDDRITAVEGSSSLVGSIDQVLATGNDADGQEIINLSNVSSSKVTVDGIELTNVGGVLSCGNDIDIPVVNCSALNCILGGDVQLGKYVGDDSVMFKVLSNHNNIVSYSDAELIGFKTIDDMAGQISDLQNAVTDLQQYNEQLKVLILSISQSLTLKHPDTLADFDYTNLL